MFSHKNRNFILVLTMLSIVLFLFASLACTSVAQGMNTKAPIVSEGDEKPPRIAQGRPAPASREEMEVTFASGELQLDPRKSFQADEAQIFTALYEGLFSYHPLTLEAVPAIASKWDISEDKKTWTFTLRDDARYWNGDAVVSSHFRQAWLSLLDPKKESPYSSLFDLIEGAKDFRLGREKDSAKVGIIAPDPHTLILKLTAPAAFLPSVLCHHSFAPVHPTMLNIEDWSSRPPLSNGPFYILETKEDRLVLARNELYWDVKRVAFKKLTIRFTKDPDEAATLWDSGEAHWVAGDVNLDALNDKTGISVNAMFATHYFYIRSEKAPWNDRRVRTALKDVLPWDKIREGQMLPAPTLIYPIPGYPKLEGTKDTKLEEAKTLLSDAGFPNGEGLPELLIRITPSEDSARIAKLMADSWKEAFGLKVKIDTVPYESYYQALKKSDYVVGSSTWIGDFADPYTFLQMWRADSNLNDAKYVDPEYEAIVDKSMTEEGEARWKTLSEAETLLLNGGTVLPISYTPALNIIDMNEVDGWYPNPLDIHPFKYLSFAAFRPLPGVAMLEKPLNVVEAAFH